MLDENREEWEGLKESLMYLLNKGNKVSCDSFDTVRVTTPPNVYATIIGGLDDKRIKFAASTDISVDEIIYIAKLVGGLEGKEEFDKLEKAVESDKTDSIPISWIISWAEDAYNFNAMDAVEELLSDWGSWKLKNKDGGSV